LSKVLCSLFFLLSPATLLTCSCLHNTNSYSATWLYSNADGIAGHSSWI
jgi:hypothetical protein